MNPAPNLVLIGPMGAGKSTIGKRLAQLLDLQFVDADHRLEELTGATVPVIFECEGEAGFRQREADLIAELMQGRGLLVATGGGAVLAEANRQQLRTRGFVVYLPLAVDAQLERLSRDRSRPLLAGPDRRQRLEELAVARTPLYRDLADLEFASVGMNANTAADRLADLVRVRWQREVAA